MNSVDSTTGSINGGAAAVVTVVHGRHDHLRRQLGSLARGTIRADHVVVAMGDPGVAAVAAGHDGVRVVEMPADRATLPLAAARNLGARTALEGGATTLVFLDVDCLAAPDLVEAYARAVDRFPETVWSGPVTYLPPGLDERRLARPWDLDAPHPARPAPRRGELAHDAEPDLFWSLSFAVGRDAWDRSGGFCEEYVGYGGEDTDFARQAAASGLGFGWVGDARAYHQHHPTQDPPVQHLDAILRNGALFHRRWGEWPMGGWLEDFERLGLVEREGSGWRRSAA